MAASKYKPQEVADMQKIGLNMYSLKDLCLDGDTLVKTFERVSDAGYRYVQVSGLQHIEPATIVSAMKATGLKACATHLSWDRFVDDVQGVIYLHRLYGTDHSAIGGLSDEYRNREGAERFVREATEVLPKLQEAGLDFSYHNHSQEFFRIDGRTWLDMVHDSSPGLGIKFELDVYWVMAGGADPAAYIEAYAEDMSIVHVKDMIVMPDREQRFAPVGSGNLNWPRILDEIRKSLVEFVIVEQDEHYNNDPLENVAKSHRFLAENGFQSE